MAQIDVEGAVLEIFNSSSIQMVSGGEKSQVNVQ